MTEFKYLSIFIFSSTDYFYLPFISSITCRILKQILLEYYFFSICLLCILHNGDSYICKNFQIFIFSFPLLHWDTFIDLKGGTLRRIRNVWIVLSLRLVKIILGNLLDNGLIKLEYKIKYLNEYLPNMLKRHQNIFITNQNIQ